MDVVVVLMSVCMKERDVMAVNFLYNISFIIMFYNTWFVRSDKNTEFSDKLECPINSIHF